MQNEWEKISVVIPAYNEEEVIRNTLTSSLEYLEKQHVPAEIIVVDDGSTDRTPNIVKEFPEVKLVSHEKNYGKGRAVRTGYLLAENPIVVVMDADNSLPLSNFDRAKPLIKDYHIVIASRYLDKKEISKYPLMRKLLSKTFSMMTKILFGLSVTDTQCGFKIFKKPYCDDIFKNAKIQGWSYDVEILYSAHKKGLKIAEFPVHFVPAERDSKIKNQLITSIKMFTEILKIRFMNY